MPDWSVQHGRDWLFLPAKSRSIIIVRSMRVWKRPARAELPVMRQSQARQLSDAFVSAAHHQPSVAVRMLTRDRSLASARASWNETGLQAASHMGHGGLLRKLVRAGAHQDLFAACTLGDRQAVSALLPAAERDACGVHGLPMAHFAVMSRDVGMLDFLIGEGVMLNPPLASLSPLHSAVAIGSVPMIRALIGSGVDCTAKDAYGATALDWAYELDDRGTVLAVLLAAGLRGASFDLRTAS